MAGEEKTADTSTTVDASAKGAPAGETKAPAGSTTPAPDAKDAKAAKDESSADPKMVIGKDAKETSGEKPAEKTDDKGDDGEGDAGETDGGGDAEKLDLSKIKVPEGTQINEKWMGELGKHPVIQKLNQGEVQGLIDTLGEYVGDIRAEMQQAQFDAQRALVTGWSKQLESNEWVQEKGGVEKITPLAVTAVNVLFGDLPGFDEFMVQLTKTGFGTNPAMVVGLARAAERFELSEGSKREGGAPPQAGGKESAAEKLFPDYAPGGKYAER